MSVVLTAVKSLNCISATQRAICCALGLTSTLSAPPPPAPDAPAAAAAAALLLRSSRISAKTERYFLSGTTRVKRKGQAAMAV